MKLNTAGRRGFTLIELVIVVLVLGIIAAIAAPRLFDVTTNARENSTRQSLVTIRNAIDLYRASTGIFPPAASLQAALADSLQGGTFPAAQVGVKAGDATVRSFTGTFSAAGTNGWAYDETNGNFFVDDATYGTW